MSTAARAIFAALVVATLGAFFTAQRLKNSPSAIQQFQLDPFFSPNRDGRFDRARVTFKLKEADHVTVRVVDDDGDEVRTLLDDTRLPAYTPVKPSLRWDGRDNEGRVVPDGRYRIRLTLRDQGRAVTVPRSLRKDTRPPRPRVLSIGPAKVFGPELLPGDKPATAHFADTGPPPAAGARDKRTRHVTVLLFKLAPGKPRQVLAQGLDDGARSWSWDGTNGGRRVSAGTYLVAIQTRDQAGNIGTSTPLGRGGLPAQSLGARLPGRGGITVRYLAVQPPSEPVKARETARFGIDARRRRYTWAIRRIGTPRAIKRGRGTRPIVRVQAPGGVSGVYLFEVRTRRHFARVPFAVQARRPHVGTARRPRGALVVLPVMTWQGRNPIDDDGDGAPNLLDRGVAARLGRVYAGDGLPAGFAAHEAPALGWLDRTGRRYDLTTDAALLAGNGPRLAGHRGVLIPGDARWLPVRVRSRLRDFVRRGGILVSLGTDSLRRTVGLADGRLVAPSGPKATDLFGARLRPIVRKPTSLEIFQDEEIGLFGTTGGFIPNVGAWEETAAVGREADLVANAVTVSPPGKTVVIAARFGEGLVIRTGIPDFQTRLTPEPVISELMARMWTLLSR